MAEIDIGAGTNRPWFIGFAPVDDPQIAVAVMLERCTGCFGGDAAGPVATRVTAAALGEVGWSLQLVLDGGELRGS